MALTHAWLSDLLAVGYEPPPLDSTYLSSGLHNAVASLKSGIAVSTECGKGTLNNINIIFV